MVQPAPDDAYPVDSTTRACCRGIGRHTPDCPEPTTAGTDSRGRPATGIPPIECPSWCTDPGHVAECGRADQNCYSADQYVMCSLEEVEITKYGVHESMVGATAYRRFGCYPVVNLHVYGFEPHTDVSINLTAGEAVRLAQALLHASDLIVGAR